jgi:hypothetical protein
MRFDRDDALIQTLLHSHVTSNSEENLKALTSSGLSPIALRHGLSEGETWHDELVQRCRSITFKNLRLAAEMTRLSSLASSHDLRLVPWKGPSLTVALYHDFSLRPFNDLDFLIADHQLDDVVSLLQSEGYLAQSPHDEHAHLLPLDSRCSIEFWHPTRGIAIDLTFKLIPLSGSRQQVTHMIERATLDPPTSFGKPTTPILNLQPDDLFLSLALHGSKHGWERASWVLDLAILSMPEYNINWNHILTRAKQAGQSKHLASAILTLHHTFHHHTSLPDDLLTWAKKKWTHQPPSQNLSTDDEIKLLFRLHDHRRMLKTLSYLCLPSIQNWHGSHAESFMDPKLWAHRLGRAFQKLWP